MHSEPQCLGVLVAVGIRDPGFVAAVRLAEAALDRGMEVYFYLLDEAVPGVAETRIQSLRARGTRLFACAYAARQRGLRLGDQAVWVGLTSLAELATSVDRFVGFTRRTAGEERP